MTDNFRREWDKFLAGEWTEEPPAKPGVYYIADYQGKPGGNSFIVYKFGENESIGYVLHGRRSDKASEIWEAYFWSVPTPELPPVSIPIPSEQPLGVQAMCDVLSSKFGGTESKAERPPFFAPDNDVCTHCTHCNSHIDDHSSKETGYLCPSPGGIK